MGEAETKSETLILTKDLHVPHLDSIEVYLQRGGYQGLIKALEYSPADLIELVKKSGLRGRGGAGFPTGMKWGFIPKGSPLPKYLCCNADEGEPGTFKDRILMEKNPHLLIEGMAIAAYAIGARQAYLYLRGEFSLSNQRVRAALQEAYERNFLGKDILGKGYDLDILIHRGAGAYICGEETSLLESTEGKRGYPRIKPPFPAQVGLFGGPTIINNVETLCNVPPIVVNGPEWFAGIGTEKSTGTKLFGVSGHVNRPGLYELPMGTPLEEILYQHCGGIRGGKQLKAVIPGGSSTPVLTAEEALKVRMDFDSVAAAGSMLGSGAVIVIDETTCMVKVGLILARFYHHEACGQCTPCREGTGWIERVMDRIEGGLGQEKDLDLLLDLCDNIDGKTVCPMGDAAIAPIRSGIRKFRQEYEEHIRRGDCPFAPDREKTSIPRPAARPTWVGERFGWRLKWLTKSEECKVQNEK